MIFYGCYGNIQCKNKLYFYAFFLVEFMSGADYKTNGYSFAGFQPIAKVFPLNHLLCTVHDGHGLMHREIFPVNSVFCAQLQKFSHSKVLPYMVR